MYTPVSQAAQALNNIFLLNSLRDVKQKSDALLRTSLLNLGIIARIRLNLR
jgi:hypothetical protein